MSRAGLREHRAGSGSAERQRGAELGSEGGSVQGLCPGEGPPEPAEFPQSPTAAAVGESQEGAGFSGSGVSPLRVGTGGLGAR